jgi:hypothetical protein
MRTTRITFVLVAAIAMLGSAAPASALFHAKEYPVKVVGEKNSGTEEELTIGQEKLNCIGKYNSTAQLNGDSEQLKLLPVYSSCTTILKGTKIESKVKRNTNGCAYNYHQGKAKLEGSLTLECPPGQEMKVVEEVLSIVCEIEIPGQGPLNGVKYKNLSTTPKTFSYESNLKGLKYKVVTGCEGLEIEKEGTAEAKEGNHFEAFKDTSPFGQVDIELI